MDGHEPGSSLPYPDLPPPAGGLVTQPIPMPGPPTSAGPPARPPARWTAGAKATAIVLTLTTVAGVGFGISQFTAANDRQDEIVDLEQELADADDDFDDLDEQLGASEASIVALQGRLEETSDQLTDVAARRDALASLFPITSATLAGLPPIGTWGLENSTDASQCTGFSDPAASCVPENFPTDIVVTGSGDAGYVVSSAWYPAIALAFDGTRWSGSGPLSDGYSNTCGGAVNTTTIQVAFSVTGATADEVAGNLFTAQLTGTVSVASGETEACVAASRSAGFVTAAG